MKPIGPNAGPVGPSPMTPETREKKSKPSLLARIREAECIGCNKCVPACPVDAIIGAAKQMHTVVAIECIGCELCIPACPVDCIDLVETGPLPSLPEAKARSSLARRRHQAKKRRLAEAEGASPVSLQSGEAIQAKQRYIEAAVARAKTKR